MGYNKIGMSFLSSIFGKKAEANNSVDFKVSLSCGKCVKRVEDLMSVDKAVTSAKIDLASKSVSLKYDDRMTNEQKLKEAIESLGFEVEKN